MKNSMNEINGRPSSLKTHEMQNRSEEIRIQWKEIKKWETQRQAHQIYNKKKNAVYVLGPSLTWAPSSNVPLLSAVFILLYVLIKFAKVRF